MSNGTTVRPQLRQLAIKYGTDKAGGRDGQNNHEYCEAYEMMLSQWRDDDFAMIELGVGGYQFPERGGQGLRMWRDYFTKALIYGIDLHYKNFEIPGVTILQGSQTDEWFLTTTVGVAKAGGIIHDHERELKLIVDDASHVNQNTIKSFQILWPMLAPGGIYVVEDVHTSYWPGEYGGGNHDETVMHFFKNQTDYLNHQHWVDPIREHYHPEIAGIESIHFFKEIIFIQKKFI